MSENMTPLEIERIYKRDIDETTDHALDPRRIMSVMYGNVTIHHRIPKKMSLITPYQMRN